MKIRRVVTAGTREQPKFVDEELDSRHPPLIGNQIIRLAAFDAPPQLPLAVPPAIDGTQFFPPTGGARVAMWTIPAPGGPAAPKATSESWAETDAIVPGMLSIENDDAGMHATSTIDVQYVISGSVEVKLDGGAAATLHAGDMLIIDGQHHAWNNPGSEDCVLLAFFYGGSRD